MAVKKQHPSVAADIENARRAAYFTVCRFTGFAQGTKTYNTRRADTFVEAQAIEAEEHDAYGHGKRSAGPSSDTHGGLLSIGNPRNVGMAHPSAP